MFRNNLVSFEWDDVSTWVNIGPNTDSASFTFDHNLWFAWDDASQSEPSLPSTETGGIYELDPGLDSDFHIAGSSPAAGAGTTPAQIAGDLDGICYRDPPSLGALETTRKLAVTRAAAHTGDWGLEVGGALENASGTIQADDFSSR